MRYSYMRKQYTDDSLLRIRSPYHQTYSPRGIVIRADSYGYEGRIDPAYGFSTDVVMLIAGWWRNPICLISGAGRWVMADILERIADNREGLFYYANLYNDPLLIWAYRVGRLFVRISYGYVLERVCCVFDLHRHMSPFFLTEYEYLRWPIAPHKYAWEQLPLIKALRKASLPPRHITHFNSYEFDVLDYTKGLVFVSIHGERILLFESGFVYISSSSSTVKGALRSLGIYNKLNKLPQINKRLILQCMAGNGEFFR